jgi:polyisoprenyl-teichoic acid--peptidoglycan teichoic acid transferase
MQSQRKRSIWRLPVIAGVVILVLLAACQFNWPPGKSGVTTQGPSLTPSLTAIPHKTRVWPGPAETPVTPVPDPLSGLTLHKEVESIVLLGLDQDFPYSGRTDAVYLILYNRRTSMASVISIPPDLFVYVPGQTMQRVNSAYPVGGIQMVKDTLEYNLGIVPDHYLLVQLSDFSRLVNAVGGIDVVVIDDLSDPCQLTPGSIHMNGDQAFCYAVHRRGADDIDRNRRQLQVMRAFFLRLLMDGEIIRLPELYTEFKDTVQTDLTLGDLFADIPLAIQLADPQRVAYYQISWDEVTQWLMPGRAKTIVLLPNREAILELLQEAVSFIMSPAPYSDLAATLQYQLTQAVMAAFTPTFTPAPPTLTPTPQTPTPTGSITTSTVTSTSTITLTPTPTPTLGAYP